MCGDVFGGQWSVVSPVFCMQDFVEQSTLFYMEKSDIDREGGFQKKVIYLSCVWGGIVAVRQFIKDIFFCQFYFA